VEFSGSWRLQDEVPSLASMEQPLTAAPRVQRMTFEATALRAWDSGLVTFVLDLMNLGAQRQIVVEQGGLPDGLRRLLHLATTAFLTGLRLQMRF
jgi:phospholipid/cholesterol/gamma-HCH transport system permease protein